MSIINEIATLALAGTKKGKIIVSDIEEPYGKGTANVISIAIALNGKDIEWKAHIPHENLDGLIKVLQNVKAQDKNNQK